MVQVVKLLVDNGADLAKTDAEGLTPIHEASRSGRVHVMQWLLDQHPYGYLPATYMSREQSESRNTYSCYNPLLWMLAWVYPAAELTAGVVCCLPVWQTCSPTTAARDDE
jgi:ankyrin repeat protein